MSGHLVCEEVGKDFGGQAVLRGVGFSLAKGECVALLGESGCGKTTLLNIIAGFLRADRGRVLCEGRVIEDRGVHVPVAKRDFAMVFQDFSLWPHMTVTENVGFGLRMRGVRGAEREARVRTALERVGLIAKAEARPAQLSGGQQQRVAIARALVVEPQVLLLDEPLSALDARLREDLRAEIANLVRELRMTAVYVTHDQSEAMAVAHRVAVMRAGRIEQLDTPEKIYQCPATLYVAKFLGAANALPAEFSPGAGRAAVVRREEVRIFLLGKDPSAGAGAGRAVLAGRCRSCIFVGERYEIGMELGSGEELRGYSAEFITPGGEVAAVFEHRAVLEVAE